MVVRAVLFSSTPKGSNSTAQRNALGETQLQLARPEGAELAGTNPSAQFVFLHPVLRALPWSIESDSFGSAACNVREAHHDGARPPSHGLTSEQQSTVAGRGVPAYVRDAPSGARPWLTKPTSTSSPST